MLRIKFLRSSSSFLSSVRCNQSSFRQISGDNGLKAGEDVDPKSYYYPNTSVGIKERSIKADKPLDPPIQTPIPPHPDGKNPKTGEVGGPGGPEPTRFGDWERKGRVSDF